MTGVAHTRRWTARIVILGTGGTSRDILDTIWDVNDSDAAVRYECVAFLDDNRSLWGSTLHDVRISGPLASARDFEDCVFVNGIGSPGNFRDRERIIGSLGLDRERFATIVHPSASVSRTARIGRGSAVLQHVTIASNVRIGDHVVILPNSVVSHDVQIGDYTCVAGAAAISGGVRVGRAAYVGTGAAIIGGVTLGDGSLIGMGSIVRHDVAPASIVVGNPASPLVSGPGPSPSSCSSAPLPPSTRSPAVASR
jgi:sugar O-acyltransferase (sialic acid O-acetyltransferase NeuD family)